MEGMGPGSSLTTVEIDRRLQAVAESVLGAERTTYVCADGAAWLESYDGPPFDLIFADTWPGKFTALDRALSLVAADGRYVVDDLRPQPTWPADHASALSALVSVLRAHPEFRIAEHLDVGSGVLVASRIGSA
jgi:predicted O-methyltransferase YrrM